MIKIKDIAKQAGVSPTTVSNVIHGNTKRVSTATIERIQKILEESNYIPSMAARLLAKNCSNIIGVVIGQTNSINRHLVQDPFFNETITSLEEIIRQMGYYMMLYTAEQSSDVFRLACTWQVDGLILINISEQECIKFKHLTKTPFISIDCDIESSAELYNVGLDDFYGGYLMGNYLVEQGHKKILFLMDRSSGLYTKRWAGFQRALKQAGIPCLRNNLLFIPLEKEHRLRQYEQLLPFIRKHSALFFVSDYYAVEGINFLIDHQVDIPTQLSVVGFDDTEYATLIRPKLTTVHQNISEKARQSVVILINLIKGKEVLEKNIYLPVNLIIRDSVMPFKN